MAKTYNLKADAQFLITDSASNTINSIDTTHTFPTISSDTVVTGTVATIWSYGTIKYNYIRS